MHAEAVLVGEAESELQGLMGRDRAVEDEPGRGRSMPEPLWQEASAEEVRSVCRIAPVETELSGTKRRAHSKSKVTAKATATRWHPRAGPSSSS